MRSSKIHVGDEWVKVSPGYVRAEHEYTANLQAEWEAQSFHAEPDEDLRQKILNKRVEFYNMYTEGTIELTQPPQLNRWQKIWRRIRNVPEPKNRYFRRVD